MLLLVPVLLRASNAELLSSRYQGLIPMANTNIRLITFLIMVCEGEIGTSLIL
jgi:hypothetical protein